MTCQIEREAEACGASFEPTKLEFDLSDRGEGILDALTDGTPQIREALASLQRRIPLPRSAVACLDRNFYRLPNHNRSFCYALAQTGSVADAPALVFKGAEPLLRDFPSMLDWMAQAPLRRSSRVMADHFPLAEGKIPGALSLSEAMREAETALEVQAKHLKHYGELARMPVPLIVHSISDQKRDKCAEVIRRKLSKPAFERIAHVLKDGLAIYVYHYPSAPIRANYSGDLSMPEFRQFIENSLDEERTVANWTRLLVRLLYLGYLPYSLRNEGLGACMDFGNAALDGGFCDPDSIVAIDVGVDDEFFRESLIQTFRIFQNTVERLLGLSDSPTLYPSIEGFVCWQYIQRLIEGALASETRPGLHLDDRFKTLVAPECISDVRSCARRKNRIPLYAHFARRHAQMQVVRSAASEYP
jgi:hypothetical protein